MPPIVIPPLVKFTLGVLGGAVVIHWAIKEVRRFNAELERVKAASAIDPAARGASDLAARPADRRVAAGLTVRFCWRSTAAPSHIPGPERSEGDARGIHRFRSSGYRFRARALRRAPRRVIRLAANILRTHTRAVSYSALMPFSRISLPQRVISSRRWRPKSSGELGDGVTPACLSRSRTSGSFRTAVKAALSRPITAAGVRAGAKRAGPLVGDGVGEALLDEGRNIRENVGALLRRGGERLELAGLDLGDDGRDVAEQTVELPAEQVGHRLRCAAIGHRLELDAGRGLVELEPEMRDGADTGDADGDGAGPFRARARRARAPSRPAWRRSPPAWSN